MNADGSGVRVVFKKPGWVVPRAWSADGKTLAVLHYDEDGMNSIYMVSIPPARRVSCFPKQRTGSEDVFSPTAAGLPSTRAAPARPDPIFTSSRVAAHPPG